jgi:thioredoxin-related protein
MNINQRTFFRTRCFRLLCSLLLLWTSLSSAETIESGLRHVANPEWFHQGLIDLEAELEAARESGKHGVMVLYTTQGCTYCTAFINKSLGDERIATRLQQQFISIGLEIFDDTEMTDHLGNDMSIKAFAESQKAGMAPTLLFYALNDNNEGELIFRAIGYQSPGRFTKMLDYLVEGHHKRTSFRDYLAALPPTPAAGLAIQHKLLDDPLFNPPPHALDRGRFASDRPLFVLFEADGCEACTNYHELVLADEKIRATLGRFEVVRLDASDNKSQIVTPDGQRITAAQWYQQEDFSRLPALMFFDEKGTQVLKTDALVELSRMTNSMGLVLDRAYEQGWSYQRYARTKSIEANNKKAAEAVQ